MKKRNKWIATTISFLSVTCLLNCKIQEEALIDYPWPKEGVYYAFPFENKVKISDVDCNYKVQDLLYQSFMNISLKKLRSANPVKQIEFADSIYLMFEDYELIYKDEHHSARMNEIFDKVNASIVDFGEPFELHLLQGFTNIAFVTVGNYIYLNWDFFGGLSDDIIAFVIGHEIGHALNGDLDISAKLIALQSTDNRLKVTISKVLDYFSTILGQSREIQCDLIALYLGNKAGYDPEAFLDFLKLLSLDDPKPSSLVAEIRDEFRRAHPWTIERVNCLEKYIDTYRIELSNLQIIHKKGVMISHSFIYDLPTYLSEIVSDKDEGETVLVGAFHEKIKQNSVKQGWVYVETVNGIKGWIEDDFVQY